MIKIYKNENNELECHVNYAGYDFKFQCIKDGCVATYEGGNSLEYQQFEKISILIMRYYVIYKMLCTTLFQYITGETALRRKQND